MVSMAVMTRWLQHGTRVLVVATLLGLTGCAGTPYPGPTAPAGAEDAGLLTLPDGTEVAVYPSELNHSGSASYRWPDGRRYDGEWLRGRPEGMGVEVLANGERYSGTWLAGQRHGHGELTLPDGSHYVGDFVEGRRQGDGSLQTVDGLYRGQWQDDLPHGQGTYHGDGGATYRGSWQQGARQGFGRHVDAGGAVYAGDWQADQPHGFGRFRDPDGSSYDGQWRSGRRHGYGTQIDAVGNRYVGTWVDGQRQGFGREERVLGGGYAGEWQANQRHGQGRERFTDGATHDGQWHQDRPRGPGTRSNPWGLAISGVWGPDGVASGLATLPSGAEYSGELFRDAGRQVAPALLAWLDDAANAGDAYAALLLGIFYLDYRVPAADALQALPLLRQAAAAGIAEGQFRLAALLAEDNAPRAIELLAAAAAQQHAGASRRLGDLYRTGERVPRDPARAAAYYRDAVAAGSSEARWRLAWLLATTPDETLRDGAAAVTLIRPLALLYPDWRHLDTLAAAYAAAGRWPEAVATQERALDAARHAGGSADAALGAATDALLEPLEERLDGYRREHPFQQPEGGGLNAWQG